MNKLLLIFSVVLISQNIYSAQRFTKFTEQPEAYINEMRALFARDETHYSQGKKLLELFEEPWINGGFSKIEQKRVYRISNLMLKRKARNFPHFYDYLQTVLAFEQESVDSLNYISWEKSLVHLLNNKKSKLRDIDRLLNSTYHLIKENAIYYSTSIKWYSNNNNYKIVLDNDTVKIVFSDLNLTGKMRKDSIVIEETSGTYYPVYQLWRGTHAKIYWDKTGLSKNIVWAEVGDYKLKMNKASYTIDNVKFYNKNYFSYSLEGKLKDKIMEVRDKNKLSYPRFDSKKTDFVINGIFKDINYKGGFSMRGNKFIGSGTPQNEATVNLYRDLEFIDNKGDTIIKKQLFMKTSSLYYTFKSSEINSNNCKIKFYIDKDSIYHPGLQFHYNNKDREINLIRDKGTQNMSRSPYYDTYHKIEMDFELLKWKMDEKKMFFTMLRGSSVNVANFESQNYFSASRYYSVQGLEQTHPYISLRRFSKYSNSLVLYDEDLAKYMHYSLTPIRHMLIDFTYRGIVDYNPETGYFTIQEKLFRYLDDIVGKVDYDLIIFESRTLSSKNNATLNLQNMDIAIEGVPMINVSDSQNVVFYPKNQEILLKKNRDFDFSGKVEAGFFSFYGANFQFKYDSFKVVLNNVDSLRIKVKDGTDNWGRKILSNVENVIEKVTGDVIIDDPTNKSGIKRYPQYPIFNSKQTSFVYYDASSIQKGKYTRDNFYFAVDAYVIDSLNNFTTEGMGYDGLFVSADIFPDIRERLVLQHDNSLGFHHQTPEEGFPVYKGKGQYFSTIHLSNQGLRGDGSLEYLTSTSISDDFIFYPDSVNAITTQFNIVEQETSVQYPNVETQKSYIHWLPYKDEFYTNMLEDNERYVMYDGKSVHKGKLLYTPEGLSGSGITSYNNANLYSNVINFYTNKFDADTANIEIKSKVSEKFALKTDNLNAKVDFVEMKSYFKSNTGASKVHFQENLYDAYIETFVWLMNDDNIILNTPQVAQVLPQDQYLLTQYQDMGLKDKGSLFISVHSGQDSIYWISKTANFDLKTNTIFAHEVNYINIADATIYPNEGEVTIEKQAYIKTLVDADLLANRDTKYHKFHEATLNIINRNKYHGEGKYNYIDKNGDVQVINFSLIAVDSTVQTFAKGDILNIEDFSLSPAFRYRGKVLLEAKKKLLLFKGYTKINHECTVINEHWLRFKDSIDPNDVYITLDKQMKDINDKFLVAGAMIATDSINVFPTFVSPRKRYSNLPIMTAGGFLTYNEKQKKYIIGSKERIADPDTTGNILTLQQNSCNMYGEGSIDLTANLGQIKINTKGDGLYNLEKDRFDLNLLMTVDFYLPDACLKYIADTLSKLTSLRPISLQNKAYKKRIREILPYDEANEMFKQQNIFGKVNIVPKQLATTFVFSELGIKWNKERTAWESTGDIGIANILGAQINRKVQGNLVITRKRSGDSFDLYLKISEDHWYYFNYKRGLMQVYSSEDAFNEIITNIKGSDRKLKIKRGESSYVFFLSDKRKLDKFLKRIGVIKSSNKLDNEDENEDYKQYEDLD